MPEQFSFNSKVTLDGVRLIPGKINVTKNANGELVEHMGDVNFKGNDIYLVETKMGSLMLTVDGLSSVELRSEDLEKNRHLATLTVVNSDIKHVEIRGNNTVVGCVMRDCMLRDSLVEYTETQPGSGKRNEVSNVEFSSADVKNTVLYAGDCENVEHDQILLTINSSTLRNGFIACAEGVISTSHLKTCSFSTKEKLTLRGAFMNDCRIETTGDLTITKGHWGWLNFKTDTIDVNGSFEMTRIETPDRDYYFYNAGDGIYCVASHKGYHDIAIQLGSDFYEQSVLYMVTEGSVVNDYYRSVAKYVLDTIASRLAVLKILNEMLEKADGKPTNGEKG